MKATLKWILFSCSVFLSIQLNGQNLSDTLKAKDLVSLSFEDLMNVKITTGTLMSLERSKVPSTLTVITREDIENTPARNLLDLLEVHVPGATFTNHWLGPRIGMRGVMGDQNNSYLLIVNGENVNSQYENGPVFEIQNKDLSDIQKIEVISGPGSVTYGPGAIGGVISITTRNAETTDKLSVGIEHNLTYRYSFINTSFALKKKNFSLSMFGSIGTSDGIKDPEFYYIDRAHGYGYGYMSEAFGNKGKGLQTGETVGDYPTGAVYKFKPIKKDMVGFTENQLDRNRIAAYLGKDSPDDVSLRDMEKLMKRSKIDFSFTPGSLAEEAYQFVPGSFTKTGKEYIYKDGGKLTHIIK